MNAEQEIVKPYLDKLKENISFLDTYDDIEVEDEFGNTNRTKYVDFYEVMETIDDLLSGEKTMTREKAIHNLKYLFFNAKALLNTEEALSMAVEALEKEPCEDCISRQAAIDACLNGWNKDYKEIVEEIRTLPPVTPQQKTGRWIEHFDESGKWYECDQCHTDWGGPVNYCPNCGAKMAESEDKE